jgi:guanylate kinase
MEREIHLLVPPSEPELCNRLIKRGHKRAKSVEEVTQLVKQNLQVYKDYKKVLLSNGIEVKFIDHTRKC